jgi:hypothetical protein
MSVRMMTLVWELDLPPGEKLVLLALADQGNDAGLQCWPSLASISKKSGQNERTVRRALRSLEQKGHLTAGEEINPTTALVRPPEPRNQFSVPWYEKELEPATKADFRRELTACLALVAPSGMATEARREWLTGGMGHAARHAERKALGPRRKPTRQDYIDLGVSPETLDGITQ